MTYVITVGSQPTNPIQNCLVSDGAGTATNGTNITQVRVICSNTYILSVTVSGLTGTGLVLITSGGQHLNVTGNGTVAFPNPVGLVSTTVAVATQPATPSETCQVESQSQPNAQSVIPISVTCSPNIYSVGVSVTGLAGSGLILANVPQSLETLPPPASSLPVSANGSLTFSTLLASGAGYQVTVSVQPTTPSQTCVVQDGEGWIANANVSLTVICSVPRFAYGAGGHGNDVLAYTVNATTGALTGDRRQSLSGGRFDERHRGRSELPICLRHQSGRNRRRRQQYRLGLYDQRDERQPERNRRQSLRNRHGASGNRGRTDGPLRLCRESA